MRPSRLSFRAGRRAKGLRSPCVSWFDAVWRRAQVIWGLYPHVSPQLFHTLSTGFSTGWRSRNQIQNNPLSPGIHNYGVVPLLFGILAPDRGRYSGCLFPAEQNYLGALPHRFASLSPPRHHPHALVPIVGKGVGATDRIICDKRKPRLAGVRLLRRLQSDRGRVKTHRLFPCRRVERNFSRDLALCAVRGLEIWAGFYALGVFTRPGPKSDLPTASVKPSIPHGPAACILREICCQAKQGSMKRPSSRSPANPDCPEP